jgi:hypothetical protein
VFGPFVHGLNKGGLTDILGHQRLLSTEARGVAGGAAAVRAIKGLWEDLAKRNNWLHRPDPNQIYIEFMTYDSPRNDGHPAEARWDVPEGQYLPIKVLRVIDGTGKVVHRGR